MCRARLSNSHASSAARRDGKALAGDVRCRGPSGTALDAGVLLNLMACSMNMCKPFLLLAVLSALLASCSQRDENEAKRKIEKAKEELRRDLHKAGQEIKKDSHEAAAGLRKDAHEAKKKMHKSDNPSGKAPEQ
jgi:hypothetical protein